MPPPTRSDIWTYFILDEQDQDKALCKICNKSYSRKGRTTTPLKSHLKSVHTKEFVLFERADKERQFQNMKAFTDECKTVSMSPQAAGLCGALPGSREECHKALPAGTVEIKIEPEPYLYPEVKTGIGNDPLQVAESSHINVHDSKIEFEEDDLLNISKLKAEVDATDQQGVPETDILSISIHEPVSVMEKTHSKSHDQFMSAMENLKPKLTSGKISLSSKPSTSSARKRPRDLSSSRLRALTSPSNSSTETCVSPTSTRQVMSNSELTASYEKIMSILNNNAQTLSDVVKQVAELSAKVNKYERSFNSGPIRSGANENDSANDPTEDTHDLSDCSFRSVAFQDSAIDPTDNDRSNACNSSLTEEDPKANPLLVEQGRKCQRFSETGWNKIRYEDVQKLFLATPVFCALKINPLLATFTPKWTSIHHLEKMDETLAAITHGLLKQRAAFEDACRGLDEKTREVVTRNVDGSKFKKVSDDLLQYVCAQRAEVIHDRRQVYKCPNKVLNELLHNIPPSETHLFAENKLTEIVREHGGIHKFFSKNTMLNKSSKKNTANGSYKPHNAFSNTPNRNFRSIWKHEKAKANQPTEK